MSKKQVWVSPSTDQWKVKSVGASRATAIVSTKSEAVAIARGVAINQKAELIVQNADGEIGWKNSYGNDKFPPKG